MADHQNSVPAKWEGQTFTLHRPTPEFAFIIQQPGGELCARIRYDGGVEFGDGVTPEAASQRFFECMGAWFAGMYQKSSKPAPDMLNGVEVCIDFPQVGTAGPFIVVDGKVRLPDVTMNDLIRHARTGYVRAADNRDAEPVEHDECPKCLGARRWCDACEGTGFVPTPAAVPAGEAVATTRHDPGFPPGPLFEPHEWGRLRALPKGTRLYTHPPAAEVREVDEAMARRFWVGYHEYFDGPARRFDRKRCAARDHGIYGAMAGLRAALATAAQGDATHA